MHTTQERRLEMELIIRDVNSEILFQALLPEIEERKGMRMEEIEGGIRISISTDNTVEMRAMVNTILRLIKVVEDALEIE